MAASICSRLAKLTCGQITLGVLAAAGSINYLRSDASEVDIKKVYYGNNPQGRVKYARVEAHSPVTFVKSFLDDYKKHSGQWKKPRNMSDERFFEIVRYEARHPLMKWVVRLAVIGKPMPRYRVKKTSRYY